MNNATAGFRQEVEIEDPNNSGVFIDITEYCSNASFAFPRDLIDTSTFGQGDKTNIVGMRDGTLSVDYLSDDTLRSLLWELHLSNDPVRINYYPEGNVGGKQKLQSYFNLVSFGDGGNIGSAVGGSAQFQRTGATTVTTV